MHWTGAHLVAVQCARANDVAERGYVRDYLIKWALINHEL